MSADALLSQLKGVRRTGPGRWVACCPAHDSKSQESLAIRELDDGRVLLHDFGGCGTHEVLQAAGLDWSALFGRDTALGMAQEEARKDRPRPGLPSRRLGFAAADVLACVRIEAGVAMVLACDVARGKVLAPSELDRLILAASRLASAAEATNGR